MGWQFIPTSYAQSEMFVTRYTGGKFNHRTHEEIKQYLGQAKLLYHSKINLF